VTILRESDVLTGARAEIDLDRDTSQVFGGEAGERVRILLTPD